MGKICILQAVGYSNGSQISNAKVKNQVIDVDRNTAQWYITNWEVKQTPARPKIKLKTQTLKRTRRKHKSESGNLPFQSWKKRSDGEALIYWIKTKCKLSLHQK